ncbi:MAG: TetR family transcriptional regulator [Mesorhizobium sp.]|nr:TetR family transcriptional regulator [Mesorhizobium sp.]
MSDEPPKRGRKPSPELRRTILNAAIGAFAARGIDAATTREIAAAATTTERTLFKHFGSKAGLVQAALEAVSIDFLSDTAFARAHDPAPFTAREFAAWHRIFLEDRVANAQRSPENYRILFAELLRNDTLRGSYGPRWKATVMDPLAAHLARMQSSGEIGRALAPAMLASGFFGLNLSYLLTRFALAPGETWDDRRDIDAIVAMFAAMCR